MSKAFLYGTWGTIAAIAIIALGYLLNSPNGQFAKATTPATSQRAVDTPIRRCMNMGGALEADNEGDWGYVIRAEDLKRIKQAGFDTVRVPIKFSRHTSNQAPYKIDAAFLKRIDQIVDWSIVAGLQVIIDVHHYEELNENPNVHEPRLYAIWEQLSYHYATAPANVMFEFINEPYGRMTVERTDALNARLLKLVRTHNKDRWVVIGSAGWGTLDALLKSNPPRDPNVVTTFHYYDPFSFTHQGAPWAHEQHPVGTRWSSLPSEKSPLAKDMARAARWRDQTGMPMLLGEFGVNYRADNQSRVNWSEFIRLEAERHGIGWCYWEWGTEFAVYDVKEEAWNIAMRRALTGQ